MSLDRVGEGAGKMLDLGMSNCSHCKQDFMKKRINQICCSIKCVTARNNKRNKLKCQFIAFNGSTSTKGAIQELRVAADLLRRGYHVFRSVSPSAHCDLVILGKDKTLKRVEVRSAVKNLAGKFFFSKRGNYDVIAGVFKNKIYYEGLN